MNEKEQLLLLSIVMTWNISEIPEYRGFRCANCQEYKNESWYHWVNSGNFRLPIHLCDDTCEPLLLTDTLQINTAKQHDTDRKLFGNTHMYSAETVAAFEEIVFSWPETQEPLLKIFTCDLCKKDLDIDPLDGVRKGWHVWWNYNSTLTELHFHNECGRKLDIEKH